MGTAASRRAVHDERGTKRGQRTREQLVAAAREVFERDGYFDARVADIVKQAGVAHGTFYTYFESKLDVFRAVARQVSAAIGEAVRVAPGDVPGDVWANLDRSNRRYLDVYRANSRIQGLIEQVATFDADFHAGRLAGRQAHVQRVIRTIERWQAQGVADPEVDPVTTAGALVAMLSNFAYWSFAGGDEYDEEQAARTVTLIWARAVGLREPREHAVDGTDAE